MSLWSGRFSKETDQRVMRFTASVAYDQRLFKHDIQGSLAHVEMLGERSIISPADAALIKDALILIGQRIERGELVFDPALEDVHMNIEQALINEIGEVGACLHTGRSRNDQVATDERLFLREQCDRLRGLLNLMQSALVETAQRHQTLIMPGLTHLQHAQPVPLSHHLLAYVEMFERDRERLSDARRRLNVLPLGAGALAGSTLPLDRESVAAKLGFDAVARNSMDAVSDRDYIIELLAALSLVAMHCSRLAEDVILWASQEFSFIELDDAFCTGSSLMPQKKNPDIAELARGKTGRVYGALMAALTMMKALPLTYNRDMQEDKEGIFDALDTVSATLEVLAPMLATARFNDSAMAAAAADPNLMATDLAEWLVRRGVPFRDAHRQVGQLVGRSRETGKALDQLSLEEVRRSIPLAEPECLELFDARRSIEARNLPGGAAFEQVKAQIACWQEKIEAEA